MSGAAAWSAISVFFAVFSALVLALVRAEISVLRERIDGSRGELVERVDGVRREMAVRFEALNARLDAFDHNVRPDGERAPHRETPTR